MAVDYKRVKINAFSLFLKKNRIRPGGKGIFAPGTVRQKQYVGVIMIQATKCRGKG